MGNATLIPPLKVDILRAGDLPTTKLSHCLEQRILRRLKEEREQRAKVSGKGFYEVKCKSVKAYTSILLNCENVLPLVIIMSTYHRTSF